VLFRSQHGGRLTKQSDARGLSLASSYTGELVCLMVFRGASSWGTIRGHGGSGGGRGLRGCYLALLRTRVGRQTGLPGGRLGNSLRTRSGVAALVYARMTVGAGRDDDAYDVLRTDGNRGCQVVSWEQRVGTLSAVASGRVRAAAGTRTWQ
jgi:hypothetical protein